MVGASYVERYREVKRRAEQERGEDTEASEDESKESESESDVTEDEEGEQLTPQVDAAILRTLQKIRSRDPEVYDPAARVFDKEKENAMQLAGAEATNHGSERTKKVTLQDYQRQRLQEAIASESDPAKAFAEATTTQKQRGMNQTEAPTLLDEEQESIRKEFLTAVPEDGDDDELFQVRSANVNDEDKTRYRETLLNALEGGTEDQVRDLLHENQADKNQDTISKENEEFLFNYVLNRGWVDQESSSKPGDKSRDWDAEAAEIDSEASFDSAADAFEHAYNFRFEDPSLAEQNFAIQSFPRHSSDTVRRTDERRKTARHERALRKAQEKEEKKRRLDQIKAQKRSSIANKLKQLRELAGGDNQMDGNAFQDIDLEADFDPEAHDRLMLKQFGDTYYQSGDVQKPELDNDDDEEMQEILQEAEEPHMKKHHKKHRSESDAMDADFIDGETETRLSKKDRKRLKKQEKKARSRAEHAQEEHGVDVDEMDAEKKRSADHNQDPKAKARELMDEYYNLGYEDIIGDTPTRFKYGKVPKEDFGMSAVEILLADDAELNQVVGLKHLQPYRRGQSKPAHLSKRLKRLRDQLSNRWEDPASELSGEPAKKKKRLGKKERQKRKQDTDGHLPADSSQE
ncbi:Kinetochore protein Spc24 [Malassezia yamatoensis]|uniref:Kinetochore protein Spc24 n=1 Tax=Malassezia yamatoensis TaxID=253288 RepID=A0AAJ6CHR9_9BASI|nr:Kinetochore protein Spc24 [Malassezia yamatoensis]